MTTLQNVASYYKGVIKLNYKSAGGFVCGWSESINIVAADDAAAIAILKAYVQYRKWTLPITVTMVYGSVIKVPSARYSVALNDMPVTGKAPDITAPNVLDMDSPQRTFCLHFIVAEGKRSIRHIHGMPDDTITGTAVTLTPAGSSWIDLTFVPTDGTGTPATYTVALKNFISFIGVTCYIPSQAGTFDVGGVPTPNSYRMRPITGILSREVRERPVGRPFGLRHGRQPIH